MKKKILIGVIIVIIILGILFIPKYLGKGDKMVKHKTLESHEIPEKINEILPKYLSEERALGCKIEEGVFVVVTRGEKNTAGYSVKIDRIENKKNKDGKDKLIVYAKFKDPKPNEIVQQVITYPFTIAKLNLNTLPEDIILEVDYED